MFENLTRRAGAWGWSRPSNTSGIEEWQRRTRGSGAGAWGRSPQIVLVALCVVVPRAAAAPRVLRGIVVDRALSDALLPSDLAACVPTIVRLSVEETEFSGQATDQSPAGFDRLEDRIAQYRRRNLQIMIAMGSLPPDEAPPERIEQWRLFVRSIVERSRGRVVAYQIGDTGAGPADAARYAFLLRLAAVQIRSVDPDALVLQGSIPASDLEWERRVFAAGVATYVDGIALTTPGDLTSPALTAMTAFVEREKPAATIVLGPLTLPSTPSAASVSFVDQLLHTLGTRIQVVALTGSSEILRAMFVAADRVSDLIAADLVILDERAAGVHLTRRESQRVLDATASIEHRLLYSLTTFDTFLVYWGSQGQQPVDLEITVANAAAPVVRDPRSGTSNPVSRLERDAAANRLRMTIPTAEHALIVDFNYGTEAPYTASVEVQKEALPRIEEIIFRHQQAQAAQDTALRNYIAHVRIEQHFHPSPADPPYNLVTENRLFSEKGSVEWEELSFELNGARWGANRPSFPLVQPEKVLSLPLDLRLNQDYAYRLEGTDTVGGRPAFVVRFDPVGSSRALYRGTVWIDRQTYARVKVQAVETKLSGPVVSNDETQLYEPAGAIGGQSIWLLSRLDSKQIFLIAGRSVLVERAVNISSFALNTPDFESERNLARAGNRIMYRDTDQGVRYFVKRGETRVVSDKLTSSARAFALGTDIDPSFDFPLPIGGLNILDFNFLNRDLQLALLYGGVIALGNIQHANLWGGKFDASVDFFGLAIKSNDDVFTSTGKLSGERVNRIPVSTGANVGYQMTPFQKVTAHYELHYDAYSRDSITDPRFVVPSSTITNGEGSGYEYRRRGYSFLTNATVYQRSTWNAWGFTDALETPRPSYARYDLGLSKDFILSTFETLHLNGTYFGGRHLDRFSMYQFGLFDQTRIHGVPADVRFAEVGMVRGSYSFNIFDQYRLDLFLEHARGREPDIDPAWHPVTGTGVRLNLRAPRSTILQVDFGKSFLPDVYRGAGSTVVQVLLLKPL